MRERQTELRVWKLEPQYLRRVPVPIDENRSNRLKLSVSIAEPGSTRTAAVGEDLAELEKVSEHGKDAGEWSEKLTLKLAVSWLKKSLASQADM